jgi:plastocyanin
MARGRTLGVCLATALLCTVALPAHAATAFVHAQNFSWVPQEVTVLAGDTVQWGNDDNVTHSVTDLTCARAGGSGSPCLFDHDLGPGTQFTFTFDDPGLYEYECAIHIFLGRVKVLGPSSALSDLVITSTSAAPAGTTAPTTLRLTAELANISTVAGSGRSDVLFQYRPAAQGEWRTIGTSLANALPVGGTTTARILWDVLGKAGDFQIRAVADGLNQVPESNETNNDGDPATTSVLVPPGTVSPGIDLSEGL